jgi:putative colanic acid biosynthesis acetyltransferase WcaF
VTVDLSANEQGDYVPGRPLWMRAAWLAVEALVLRNPLVPVYTLKRAVLSAFGASVGRGVLIKPSVRVKHPWRLRIGDRSWIGEGVWIDNVVQVDIGADVCLSQGVYLTTGNHDWSDPGMRLRTAAIRIEDGAWLAAFARVAPGVTVGREAVVGFGAVLAGDAEPGGIYTGSPARRTGDRAIVAR